MAEHDENPARTASGRFVPAPAATSYDDDDLIVPKAAAAEERSLTGSGFGPAPPAITRRPAPPPASVPDPFAADPFADVPKAKHKAPEKKAENKPETKSEKKKRAKPKKPADPFADDPFARPDAPAPVETPSSIGADPFASDQLLGVAGKKPEPKAKRKSESRRERNSGRQSERQSERESGRQSERKSGRQSERNKSESRRSGRESKADSKRSARASASAEPKIKARPRVVLPPPANIVPSTGLTDTSLEPHEVPKPSRKPLALVVTMCGVLVIAVAIGGWAWVERDAVSAERETFLGLVDFDRPERGLRAAKALSPAALEDPEVKKVLERLRLAKVDSGSRRAAEEILARLEPGMASERRLEICNEALGVDPRFPRALLERARAQLQRGRAETKEPLADLYTALTADPEFVDAYVERADLLLALGRTQAAETDLERAVELGGSSALATLASAHLAALQEDPRRARQLYTSTLNRRPDDATRDAATRGLARVLLDLDEDKEAWEVARQAQELSPRSPDSHLLVAEARERTQPDRDASLADLARALRLDPNHPRALALRGWLQLQGGESAAARASAEQSLKADPKRVLAHLTLAQLAKDARRLTEAVKHADGAVEIARGGTLVRALVLRARARLDQSGGFTDAVRTDLDRALEVDPTHPDALSLRAEAKAAKGDREGALIDLDVALRSGGALPESYFLRATLNLESKPAPLRLVIDDLTRALALSPRLTKVYLPRATAYQRASRYDDALADLDRAKGHASEARLAFVRGHCLYGKGNWKGAKQAFAEFLRLDPRSSDRAAAEEKTRECDAHLRVGSSDF